MCTVMERDRLGGFPFEVVKDGKITKIRFFPKNPNAKDPHAVTFVLPISQNEKQKLLKILESIK